MEIVNINIFEEDKEIVQRIRRPYILKDKSFGVMGNFSVALELLKSLLTEMMKMTQTGKKYKKRK